MDGFVEWRVTIVRGFLIATDSYQGGVVTQKTTHWEFSLNNIKKFSPTFTLRHNLRSIAIWHESQTFGKEAWLELMLCTVEDQMKV